MFSQTFSKDADPVRNFAYFRITRQSPAERGWGVYRVELQMPGSARWRARPRLLVLLFPQRIYKHVHHHLCRSDRERTIRIWQI